MPDEIKQDEDVEEVEAPVEKKPDTQQEQKGKVFSQEELNKVVAREKASWKKQSERLTADHETIVASFKADLTKRDEVIQAQVDLLKKDLELDEITSELLAEKDALEQFQTLVKIMEKQGKQDAQFPRTPQGRKQKDKFQSNFKPNL